MSNVTGYLLLSRLKIQNANAISSPLTWGFPAPSAFTGFAHALQRKLTACFSELQINGVGIIAHGFEPQVAQPAGKHTQVFCLTRNPLDKDGSTASIVEEGRVHLQLSLLLEISHFDRQRQFDLCERCTELILGMRLAGGSILPQPSKHKLVEWYDHAEYQEQQSTMWLKLRKELLPGFALIGRDELLQQHWQAMQKTQADASLLDAWLDLSRLNFQPSVTEKTDEKVAWTVVKKPGWIVPIPVGYQRISQLYAAGEVKNARDMQTPFAWVECIYSLGEWKSPHRLQSVQQLLWRTEFNAEQATYRCVNQA